MERFAPGYRVTVNLTDDHRIIGSGDEESAGHLGMFVAYHLNGDGWADVDLDEAHAGGVRRISVPVGILEKV